MNWIYLSSWSARLNLSIWAVRSLKSFLISSNLAGYRTAWSRKPRRFFPSILNSLSLQKNSFYFRVFFKRGEWSEQMRSIMKIDRTSSEGISAVFHRPTSAPAELSSCCTRILFERLRLLLPPRQFLFQQYSSHYLTFSKSSDRFRQCASNPAIGVRGFSGFVFLLTTSQIMFTVD